MAEPTTNNPFIIISGHDPKAGKRERISRVRAHITKRYFHKLHKGVEAKPRRHHTSLNQIGECEGIGEIAIIKELRNSMPATSHPLLDPACFTAETTRRMHKCEPPLFLIEQSTPSQKGNCVMLFLLFLVQEMGVCVSSLFTLSDISSEAPTPESQRPLVLCLEASSSL